MNESLLISINLPTLLLLIITLLAIGACFFLMGYIYSSSGHTGVYNSDKKLLISDKKLKTNISIDETKIVTKINTDNLEKKYNQLGEIKNSQENISSSVNKLKALKGE